MTEDILLVDLIDVDLWTRAEWMAVAFIGGGEYPMMGFVFRGGASGRRIFEKWRQHVGPIDRFEELRISVIEGHMPGAENPGYSVNVGASIEGIHARATAEKKSIPSKFVVLMRGKRMNAGPESPHLPMFKRSYEQHRRFGLVPVTLGRDGALSPHFDLAIEKSAVHFRRVEDVAEKDLDRVAFPDREPSDSN